MLRQYLLATLGCKVNQYETQLVRSILEHHGFRPAATPTHADLAVVNTCAVTSTALAKSRQTVRQLARSGRTRVVVIGCGASAEAQRLRAITGVEAVWGHDVDVPSALGSWIVERWSESTPSNQEVAPNRVGAVRQGNGEDDGWISPLVPFGRLGAPDGVPQEAVPIIPVPLPIVKDEHVLTGRIDRFEGRQRAFVKVQDGCDAFCTYCIIPRLRPVIRWKPIPDVVDEVRGLVGSGYREVILTGIFLGAYGRATALRKRFGARAGPPLARLVSAAAEVPGLQRLRLSSLEPGDLDDALIDALLAHPACVPHLHLPLQSGSTRVLSRMNRQYTAEQFLETARRVREALDRPALTTDVVVGFPGETEEDFARTCEVARLAGFCKIHAFPFSPRPQTAAARWQREFIHGAITRERMERLADLERELSITYRRQFIGGCERVIIEGDSTPPDAGDPTTSAAPGVGSRGLGRGDRDPAPSRDSGPRVGRADRYFAVHFDAPEARPGDVLRVRIDRITPTRTHGTRLLGAGGPSPLPVWREDADASDECHVD